MYEHILKDKYNEVGGFLLGFSGIVKEKYLFCWDEIPGNDNEKLKTFFIKKFSSDWVKTANIEKIDDNNTIRVTSGDNSLSLKRNDENLKIDDCIYENFIANNMNDKLYIYEKKSGIEEIVLYVVQAVEGVCDSSRAHVRINSSTYNRAWKEIDKSKFRLSIVGWYHTHPDIGIFLSGTDKNNMKMHHRKPHSIAIVIDPLRGGNDYDWGVFGWKDKKLEELDYVHHDLLNGNDYEKYVIDNDDSND